MYKTALVSVGNYSLKCSHFFMKQIVITLKNGTFEPTSHFLTTDPNPLLLLAKRDCVTKNFETQVIARKNIPF